MDHVRSVLALSMVSVAHAAPILQDFTSYEAGFTNPAIVPSAGGFAICVQGDIPVTASAKNLHLNYTAPASQTVVINTILEFLQTNSTL